ncbi:membrane protein [Streptomyces camponoticapitis]|uniref:Membrane protein n=1 Tax=Streptomyces camponoticapitis TaxID=1616125 RepID=A0ABQ2EFU1_9ACTN|nr:DUF1772 domain-containing protein [Streptomyces camponoticapitis]GGK06220.1 membrane protein [Streptomyces camponoticapitis]
MTYDTQHRPRTESDVLRTVTLILAIMTTGLIAGVFASWSNAIMPGLGEVGDRTFVPAFQALDEAINNPLFLGGFTLALPLIALSAALHRRAEQRAVLMWVGAALVFYLVAVVITFGVHEPLNGDFRTAAEPGSGADLAAARARLDEAKWTAWNTARAVTSTVAFGCLAWALVIRGRLDRTVGRRAAR